MNKFILSVHFKSGNSIIRELGTEASLNKVKLNFDEELRQEIFHIDSANEKISIPTENIDYYDLRVEDE